MLSQALCLGSPSRHCPPSELLGVAAGVKDLPPNSVELCSFLEDSILLKPEIINHSSFCVPYPLGQFIKNLSSALAISGLPAACFIYWVMLLLSIPSYDWVPFIHTNIHTCVLIATCSQGVLWESQAVHLLPSCKEKSTGMGLVLPDKLISFTTPALLASCLRFKTKGY